MSLITVRSKAREQVIDVTEDLAALASSMRDGICSLFVQHTTCALTVRRCRRRIRHSRHKHKSKLPVGCTQAPAPAP